jgi:hypothetical protein
VSFKFKTLTVYKYILDYHKEGMIVSLENKYRYLLRKIMNKKCIFFQEMQQNNYALLVKTINVETNNYVLLVKTIIAETINVYQ